MYKVGGPRLERGVERVWWPLVLLVVMATPTAQFQRSWLFLAVDDDRLTGSSCVRGFINITPDVALTVQLLPGFDPIQWTLVGKDGAATPSSQRMARLARQLVSVGETYDFEVAPRPPTPAGLWMELRRGNGELLFQWPVRIR